MNNFTMNIRLASERDGSAIAGIYAPIVRDTFISFETEPPTPEEMSQRVASTLAQFPWLIAEADNEIIGYAYAGSHRTRPAYRWSCDVSIYLAPDAKRRGVGRCLYDTLFDHLKRQGYSEAFAGIALPNEASVGFHEAMGFDRIGIYPRVGFKSGSWRDVGWWHRSLQTLSDNPEDPIPFRDLIELKA